MKLHRQKKLIFFLILCIFVVLISSLLFYKFIYNSNNNSYAPVSTSDIQTFIDSYSLPPASETVEREEIEKDGYVISASKEGNIDSPVSFSVGEGKISFTSVGNSNLGRMNNSELIAGDDGKITYENIFNGINLIYTPSKDKILEEYEVRAKRKIDYLVQKIDVEGLKYEEKEDGSIIFTNASTGEFAFAVPKPVMYEKYNTRNKSFGLHYEILTSNGNTFLVKVIDEEGLKWLEASANYPVMIDATILLTLFSYTSYPTVEGTWQVDAQTVGKGELVVKPGEGTSWNLNEEVDNSKDLNGFTLKCNEQVISYQINPDGSAVFPDFSCEGNVVLTSKVTDPSKQNSLNISYSGFTTIVESIVDTGKPIIYSSSINPPVVKVGDVITITAEVAGNTKPITSVTADITDIEKINLNLISGTNTNGKWQGTWTVRDTVTKPYEVVIEASDGENITKTSIGFFDPYTCLGGGDHAGADWNPVSDGCTSNEIAGEHTNIGIFSVNNGQTASVKAFDGVNQYGIATVSASTATIAGTLNAAGKGWGGSGKGPGAASVSPNAASHGGLGGGTPGPVYDSLTQPGELGSSGTGGNGTTTGGWGGGVIRMSVSGLVTVNGSITTSAVTNGFCAGSGGGASGGSIWISAANIAGSGTIYARGGNNTGCNGGYTGAGGRIAIYYSGTNTFNGTISVTPGTGGSGGGASGTAFIENISTGDLLIPAANGGNWNGNERTSWNFHDLTINGDVIFKAANASLLTITATGSTTFAANTTTHLKGSYTNNSDGVGVYLNLKGDINIPSTSSIKSDGYGYAPSGNGPGAASASPNGASHGGLGGGTTGSVYGSLTQPSSLGSSGTGGNGTTTGGWGGGAIRISTDGTLTINGNISSNTYTNGFCSGSGGGASGGSVWLSAANLAGSGTIYATGGNNTGCNGGYTGAGGRIAVYYTGTNTFTGTVNVAPGTGGSGGGSYGTAFIESTSSGDLLVPAVNGGEWIATERSNWDFRNININSSVTFKGANASLLTINATGSTTLRAGATWGLKGSNTTNSNGVGVYLNLSGDLTIPATAVISANSGGYSGTTGVGGGPGGGTSPGGGGYGGVGGDTGGGGLYGLSTAPLDLGSAGGGAGSTGREGGNGGGAIKINIPGTLRLNGSITANGGNGGSFCYGWNGGGSGGSIYITMKELQGAGSFYAIGGSPGGCAGGGNGGGGRIALYCSEGGNWLGNSLASSSATAKGTGGTGGGNGTVYTSNCYVINPKVGSNTRLEGNIRMR